MISLASLFLLVKLIMVTVVGLYFAEKCGYTSSEPTHHQAFLPLPRKQQLRPPLPPYAAGRTRLETTTMHTVPIAPFPLVSSRPSSRSGLQSQDMQRAVQEAVAGRTRSRSSTASSGSVRSRGSEARTRSPLKMAGLVKSKSQSREREGVKEEKKEKEKERRGSVLRAGRARSSSSSSRGVKVGGVN